jgi:F-type H+-transporting ATPase subunit epsilon
MPFDLTIVTPHGEAYQGRVQTVVLPGSEGDFGVLEGHERFLSPLRIGELEIRVSDRNTYAAISGGFADVLGERVVVLADTCELASDIDVARAERARERAEAALRGLRSEAENAEFRLQRAALERAVVRIQTAARAR